MRLSSGQESSSKAPARGPNTWWPTTLLGWILMGWPRQPAWAGALEMFLMLKTQASRGWYGSGGGGSEGGPAEPRCMVMTTLPSTPVCSRPSQPRFCRGRTSLPCPDQQPRQEEYCGAQPLAAQASPVPVAERAQRRAHARARLHQQQVGAAPDAAVTAYIDLYGQDFPDNAVNAIRAATRLGNKELSKALAAIAAESGVAEMDVA